MNRTQRRALPSPWLFIAALAALLALAVKLVIALTTIGTNDVLRWETFLANLQAHGGIGLYHRVSYYNHPPFMIHVLRVMDFMTSLTGIAFPFWLRLPAILADLGSAVLVLRILGPRLRESDRAVAVALLAAAPPSILISGFHGNTDPVMIFFVLLSIYMLDSGRSAWLAGVFFGMSLNIKVASIIFVPVFILYLPNTRKRIEYLAATGAAFLIGSLPYLVQDPAFIVERVFGYGSLYGHWGLSRLLTLPWSRDHIGLLDTIYAQWGKFIVLAVIAAAAFWMNRSPKKPPLFLQCGLVAFLFMALTPGFGVQYLAWLVPWVVGIGLWATVIFYTASGIFLFLVYHFWAGEFPWRLANADAVGDWRGSIILVELLCWAAVVVVLVLFRNAIAENAARNDEQLGQTRDMLSKERNVQTSS
jgi:hypothetical protein